MTSQSNSIPTLGTAFKASSLKPKSRKRIAPLSVRLSVEQRQHLERDAIGMSLNAYVLGRLFDAPNRKKQPNKRDKAIASALRRLAHSGIAAYLASQIVAQEEGRLGLNREEEAELREAYTECYRIRRDLVEGLGLQAEYDTSFDPVTKGA